MVPFIIGVIVLLKTKIYVTACMHGQLLGIRHLAAGSSHLSSALLSGMEIMNRSCHLIIYYKVVSYSQMSII